MDVKDLMIDDWVKVDGKIGQVKMVTEFDVCVQVSEIEMINSENVEPIEITDHLLLANGFESYSNWFGSLAMDLMLKADGDEYRIISANVDFNRVYHLIDKKIKYIHQLQHIMHIFANTNKIKIETNE